MSRSVPSVDAELHHRQSSLYCHHALKGSDSSFVLCLFVCTHTTPWQLPCRLLSSVVAAVTVIYAVLLRKLLLLSKHDPKLAMPLHQAVL